jgi:hypothetical protein
MYSTLDPQPRAPLFRTHNGTLSRNKYINEMRKRLKDNGYKDYKSSATALAGGQHNMPLITVSLNTTSNASVGGLLKPSRGISISARLTNSTFPNRAFGACDTDLPQRPQWTGHINSNSHIPSTHQSQRLHTLPSLPPELLMLSRTLYTFYRAQLASHLAGPARTSPVLTGPETSSSSEVSCNGSPSGGGYVQPRLLAVLAAPAIQESSLSLLVSTNV